MTPKVTVIVPTYNRAALIGEALDSVRTQSLAGVEVIVVDDGSTDDTEARVRAFGPAIRFVRTTHGGVAHARNVGTRIATGEYVLCLDSDDRLPPYALELQAALLDRQPGLAMISGEMSAFDEHGLRATRYLRTYHASSYRDPALTYDRIYARRHALGDLMPVPSSLLAADAEAAQRAVYSGHIFDVYLLALVICQNSTMVRRSALAAVGERNEQVRYWQEVDFLLRLTRQFEVGFVDVPTYAMRFHDGQISSTGGVDGKYVWIRKQQILRRVVARHAHADAAYHARHRRRIDAHLAHLHRAVAVPLLLSDARAARTLDYPRRARVYLARCGRLGHPEPLLWAASRLPGPVRRLAVTVLERVRHMKIPGRRGRGPAPSAVEA